MATVKSPAGPFPLYSNYDRSLALFDGNHRTLKFNDQIVHLDQTSPPYSFTGEIPIVWEIDREVLTDFNVITERNLFKHRVQRFILDQEQPPMEITIANKEILFLLVIKGNVHVNGMALIKGDSIKFANGNPIVSITTSVNATVFFSNRIIPIELDK